jgi:hypothetical protein
MSTTDSVQPAMSASRPADARRVFAVALAAWIGLFIAVQAYVTTHGGGVGAWDAGWYRSIAQSGYTFDGNIAHQQPVAFLPAYPYLLRLPLALGLPLAAAILLTCVTCAVGGMVLLFRALSAALGPNTAAYACALFVASPFSFYFLNGYSESLFLLAMGAFWWALLQRRDEPLAALFAGLAGLVRPFGVLLAFVWAIDVVLRGRRNGAPLRETATRLFAFGPLAVMGPLLVCLYYGYRFGDLFLYRNILVAWGDNVVAGSLAEAVDHLRVELRTLIEWHPAEILSWPPELARLLLWASVAMVGIASRRIPPQLVAYAFALIAFCLCLTASGSNLGRHLATNIAFPVAVTLALCAPQARPWKMMLFIAITLGALTLQMYYAARYFRVIWVS